MAAKRAPVREWIARIYTVVEDVVYVVLGLLLAALVLTLLMYTAVDLTRHIAGGAVSTHIISMLDRILLVLLIVELLYTVQVSFRAHALSPEPFLLIGLISAIRRVLLLTTAMGESHDKGTEVAPILLIELGVLTGLILGLAVALWLLKRPKEPVVAERA